jgi:hypothetical protein
MAQHGGGVVFPPLVEPDVTRELPDTSGMMIKTSRQCVSVLPVLCHGVKASRDHIELTRAIVAGTGITLRGACALKVESNRPIGRLLPQDVLTLDPKRSAALEAQLNVGCPFFVELNAVCNARYSGKPPSEMKLRYPATHGHLQPACSRDKVKHFAFRQVELLGEGVQGHGGRCRGQLGPKKRGHRERGWGELLGDEMTMSLILAERGTLEGEIAKE